MVTWVLVSLVGAGVLASLDPATLGFSTYHGVAQLIALRPWLALGLLAAALVLTVPAAALRRARSRYAAPAVVLAVTLALAGAGHAGVLAARGLGTGEVPTAGSGAPGDLTVLTANLRGVRGDPADVADLALAAGADVLVLPESGKDVRSVLVALLADGGREYQVFPDPDGPGHDGGTGVLVATDVGAYAEQDGAEYRSVVVGPVDGEGPTIAAVHPRSPPGIRTGWRQGGDPLAAWRSEVAAAADLCASIPGGIVAGDFNATLDHAPMRRTGCSDAASALEMGGVGTYPASFPALLGTPIDHVFVDPAAWLPVAGAVVEIGGSDHRGLLVRLSPAG